MKISKKTDYALRALVSLASAEPDALISIRRLAQENDVPKRFLEQIMLDLREAGWLRAVPGRDGGYALAVKPADLTLGKIVRHFDGVLAPIGCVSVTRYEACSQEASCRFRRVFLNVRDHTARLLDRLTLADLAASAPVSTVEVQNLAFLDGGGI